MKIVIYAVLFSFMPTNIPDFYIRSTGCVEHVKKFEKIFGNGSFGFKILQDGVWEEQEEDCVQQAA